LSPMKKYEHRRRLSAWILLLVFVPMLLASSLHHHESSAANTECYACLHHLHHASHVNTSSPNFDNCVLCHFQSISYLGAAFVVLACTVLFVINAPVLYIQMRPASYVGSYSSRAPPFHSIVF
jgi:hypothetical protein